MHLAHHYPPKNARTFGEYIIYIYHISLLYPTSPPYLHPLHPGGFLAAAAAPAAPPPALKEAFLKACKSSCRLNEPWPMAPKKLCGEFLVDFQGLGLIDCGKIYGGIVLDFRESVDPTE